MILDLPPELVLMILSTSNIHQVHTFQLVSRTADQIIRGHSESVYHALAIYYGLAHEGQDWDAVIKGRIIYFDFLKEPRHVNDNESGVLYEGRLLVSGWREYVRRHFMLENNWRKGHYLPASHSDLNGLHRIQLDEVEGTILSTHTAGTVRSDCMQLREPLWTDHRPPAWAHCEFDHGFLIWGRGSGDIEVWRREADVILDTETTSTPDEAQILAEKDAWFRHKEFAPDDVETGVPPTVNSAILHAPKPTRGKFQAFTVLHTPQPTSASRFVYPHLVLTTRFLQYAYIYDIPANKLIKTITLEEAGDQLVMHRIYYVEHNATHIYICTEDAVYIYGKEDGRLFLRLPADTTPHVRVRFAWEEAFKEELKRSDDPKMNLKMNLKMVGVEETQYIPSATGEFCAVHVSPCGGIWVIMNETEYILVVTGGAEDPTQITVVSVYIGDPVLTYLAFDGHHIAVAGSKGIYVITLNRYRDPTLSVEAALTSLIKGHVQLVVPPPHVDMRATSCLQISDTAIWHVGRKSLHDFSSVTTKIDFAAPLDGLSTM